VKGDLLAVPPADEVLEHRRKPILPEHSGG
jgi:hypothetical protein